LYYYVTMFLAFFNFHKKNFSPLILVIVLALGIRIWKLHLFPVGITHDQMDYILNAKAIFLTGSDVSQTWKPWFLTGLPTAETVISEVFPTLLALFIGPLPLSFFSTRIFFVLASTLLAAMVYLLTERLLDKKTAFIAGIIMAISPWGIHFGRTAFEAPVGLLFYLIGIYFFIGRPFWQRAVSLLFFFLGFFTYHPYKILLLPLLLVLVFWGFTRKRWSSFWPAIMGLGLAGVLVAYVFLSLPFQPAGTRKDEFLLFSMDMFSASVNETRRASLPSQINRVFANKAWFMAVSIFSQYIQAFDPALLFLYGDHSGIGAYTFWRHGIFYYIDAVFFVLGVVILFAKKKQARWLLAGLLLIAPLPTALTFGEHYVHRSALMVPIMAIFVAAGISYFIENSKYQKLAKIGTIGIYALLFLNFYNLYFFQYPVYGSDGFFLGKRVLSSYIKRARQVGREVRVMTKSPKPTMEQYLFYSGLYNNKETVKDVSETFNKEPFVYQGVQMQPDCVSLEVLAGKDITIIEDMTIGCAKREEWQAPAQVETLVSEATASALSISSLADSGQLYRIYHDGVCSGYKMGSYPRLTSEEQLKIEKMDNQTFCENWIMDMTKL